MELWGEPAVNTQELLVHDSGEGEVAEGVHAGVVDCFRIFVLA
jgi:hypothetical protein